MSENIISDLKQIIAQDLDVNITVDEIDETQPLLETGLALDSVTIIELINQVEERFDIEFSDSDLRLRTFESLLTLAEVIRGKMENPLG